MKKNLDFSTAKRSAILVRAKKDHELAEHINHLTNICKDFGHTQQLRAHIAQAVVKFHKGI